MFKPFAEDFCNNFHHFTLVQKHLQVQGPQRLSNFQIYSIQFVLIFIELIFRIFKLFFVNHTQISQRIVIEPQMYINRNTIMFLKNNKKEL